METSYIYKHFMGARCYVKVNTREYSLNDIYFYDDNKTLLRVDFDGQKLFTYRGETKRKLKLKLDGMENFIIKSERMGFNETLYDLYIHKSNVKYSYIGKMIRDGTRYKLYEIDTSLDYPNTSFIYYEYFYSSGRRIHRLKWEAEKIIKKELMYANDYRGMDDDKLQNIFKRLERLNRKINHETERLEKREKHSRDVIQNKLYEKKGIRKGGAAVG